MCGGVTMAKQEATQMSDAAKNAIHLTTEGKNSTQ